MKEGWAEGLMGQRRVYIREITDKKMAMQYL